MSFMQCLCHLQQLNKLPSLRKNYLSCTWTFNQWALYDFCWQVKERPDIGVYVKDLTSVAAKTADDMDRVMTVGNKNSKAFI